MEGLQVLQLVPPEAKALSVLQVEARRKTRAHVLRIERPQIRTVILVQIRQKIGHTALLSHFRTWYRPLNKMRIQEKEARMLGVTILIPYQVESHVVLTACDTHILLNFEQLADLLQILRLYRIEPKSNRYQHEDRLLS